MKNKNIDNFDNYYKKSYLIISSLTLYIMIILLKSFFYKLFNLSLNNLNNIETLLINITYQFFAIAISINFYIKNLKLNLNEFKAYLKKFGISILTITIYETTTLLEIIVLYYSKVNIAHMEITAKTIYLIAFETLIMAIIALINHKKLEKDIKDIKINFKNYIDKYIKYYIYALLVMMLSNVLINSIYPNIAGNQETIVNTLKKAPIYIAFSATIFAPFAEEMIFRQSIRNIIRNNTVFIITSGLIFGGMHVIGNINSFYDVLFIIPYSAPGIAFAYILTKTDNIIVPMSIHFMHNTIMLIIQMLILFH